ncbi:MAG TPA: hypothetical protein VD913_01590 [bacterium]|nr:hypothetical protein [bacterium]
MKGSARNFKSKAEKLLRLYSLWQETRRDDLQRRCLGLLGEILNREPRFNLRQEFKEAF